MIVYDLNSGHREYPGYDEIEDRRGGGRGRSRTGLGLGLSLLRLRERHRPAGVSLDVEMMSVSSMLASIQD